MKLITIFGAVSIALASQSCNSTQLRDSTNYITKDSANKMLQSYLNSIPVDTLNPNLNSLILDADDLRDYLSNPDVTNVKIMFAHSLNYINTGNQGVPAGYKSDDLTIVLACFNNAGNYVYLPNGLVINHAIPCPRNCHDEGNASSPLLQ